MPKFNETITPDRVENLAGGTAYAQDSRTEIVSLLLTSFLADKFYTTGSDELIRLRSLVAADPEFAARAAVYARTVHGMRSVSHVVAGEVVEHVKGESWVKDFIRAVVRRPDDMTEIVAYRAATYGLHPLPNSLKKGLAAAFAKFDAYQLGKYRAEDKTVKLVDVVNLVKPRPVERNEGALRALVAGELRQVDTWENTLSAATDKTEAWRTLIMQDRVGYFALLRNMRNLCQQADDETFAQAVMYLTDPERIAKSLVLPFRYYTAYVELAKSDVDYGRKTTTLQAIGIAASHSVANIPDLGGTTLIAVDSSGSMTSGRVGGPRSDVRASHIAALFAAALIRRLGPRAEVLLFDTGVHRPAVNPGDSVLTITSQLTEQMRGGGTNMDLAFASNTPHDRVVVLSDMQAWTNGEWANPERSYFGVWTPAGTHRPAVNAYDEYRQRTGANPEVYSFDLTGYGSIQFPRERCYQLAGWSEKVFSLMGLLGEDRNAMINTIRRVSF